MAGRLWELRGLTLGVTHFSSISALEAPGLVDFVNPVTVNTAGNVTYTAQQILGKIILRNTNGAARSDQFPTASDLIGALDNPSPGASVRFLIRNTAAAAEVLTLTTNTGITLSGTMTLAQGIAREFLAVITSPGAVTIFTLGTSAF